MLRAFGCALFSALFAVVLFSTFKVEATYCLVAWMVGAILLFIISFALFPHRAKEFNH